MSRTKSMNIDLSLISDHDEEDDDCIIIYSSELKKRNTSLKQENRKQEKKLKTYDEDCMILDYDPFQSIVISHVPKDGDVTDDDDISIVAESGLVVCRDFPHSRHLCAKFPFDSTPHPSYCAQCYCYVCDSAAPCKFWHEISGGHCHASERDGGWYWMRKDARKTSTHAKTTEPNMSDDDYFY